MASIGHVFVGMALGRAWAPSAKPRHLFAAMVLMVGLSVLPDADVVAFALDIPYHAPFGHRGASHSIVFAALMSALAWALARLTSLPSGRAALFTFAAVLSHPLLDALTDGGLGVALFWPVTSERFFFPVQPIPVAPIGLGFLSGAGMRVALFELLLFAPMLAYSLWPRRRPVHGGDLDVT